MSKIPKKTYKGLVRPDIVNAAKHILKDFDISIYEVIPKLGIDDGEDLSPQFEADFDSSLAWLSKQIAKLKVPK